MNIPRSKILKKTFFFKKAFNFHSSWNKNTEIAWLEPLKNSVSGILKKILFVLI